MTFYLEKDNTIKEAINNNKWKENTLLKQKSKENRAPKNFSGEAGDDLQHYIMKTMDEF